MRPTRAAARRIAAARAVSQRGDAMTQADHTEPVDKNLVDRSIEAISKALSYSFALSIVVTIYDVIRDVIFNSPTVWVYDVVTTAIAVAFLIGGSYALMRRDHIRITALYVRFSERTRLRCDIVTSILALLYLGAFAWFAFDMAETS